MARARNAAERPEVERKAYTVPELQAMYGYSRQHIYDLIHQGELAPVIRSGRAIRVPVSAVEAWERRSTGSWPDAHAAAS